MKLMAGKRGRDYVARLVETEELILFIEASETVEPDFHERARNPGLNDPSQTNSRAGRRASHFIARP
jgi:hypothetical protein